MGQVGIPTAFWYSRGRIQTTRSRFLHSWQGGDGGGGLTDRREVGSAEGEGATMGGTKDASGDRYKWRISGMQNSARDGADRPKDRKTNGSRDVKSMDHSLPSSGYLRQHERENGLRRVDSLRSRGVSPPLPLTRVTSPCATAKASRANDG